MQDSYVLTLNHIVFISQNGVTSPMIPNWMQIVRVRVRVRVGMGVWVRCEV